MHRFLFLTLVSYQLTAANWPQWRGPSANGISPEKNVPIQWSPGENILWKIPLRGLGASTPIVWGDRIFVTSQVGDGPFEQRGRDFDNASIAKKTGNRETVQFAVHSFARTDGHLLWEYKFDAEAEGGLPAVHMKHNLAAPRFQQR